MATYYVLYHESSGKKDTKDRVKEIEEFYEGDTVVYKNVMDITSYSDFFGELSPEDNIVIAGGDGSLNQFINRTEGIAYSNKVFYYAMGTGNDFLHDIGGVVGEAPIQINQYIVDLPKVTVKGKTYRYLNGIGYGIDGYCCEVGDKIKATSDKPVDYTGIAIKGLLFHYKPTNAVITVDGERHEFGRVWLAPTMNGRFYGGGMMAAPAQDRLNPERTQSVVAFYGHSAIPTLIAFPSIFKGKHVEKSMVKIFTGKKIKVEFDSPRALQIDGETILDVMEYEIEA